ncbi:MAG: AarF/UbiB family protein [Verrucomicrobiota bacterium]
MAIKPFEIISNAVRAKEIVTVLARNGFAGLLHRLDLPQKILGVLGRAGRDKRGQWERMRIVLEELGPTFVKFGQLLSMRPDVVPEPLIKELRLLQERVTATPFEEMRPIIEEGLGRPIDEVFSSFEEEPLASASMAMVYKAVLSESGDTVAVKAQRPNLDKTIDADFDILMWFVNQAHARLEEIRPFNLPDVAQALREGLTRELDFRQEARNMEFFELQNAYPEDTHAPKAYDEYCSRRVLVMEHIEWGGLTELTPGSVEAKRLARVGSRSLFNQILLNGFFHADPHAGNLKLMKDGRICFMDWGLVGQMTQRMRFGLADLFLAFVKGEAESISRIAISLADSGSPIDRRTLEREALVAMRKHYDPASGKGEVGKAILEMLYVFGRNGIDLAKDYSMMAKSILCVEETGRSLDPEYSLRDEFEPVLIELIKERRSPIRMAKELRDSFMEGIDKLQVLPEELHRILTKVEKDRLKVNMEHKGLKHLDDTISDSSNKITLGIIIGCLLVGSSLIVSSNAPPILLGFPILGVVGYLLSIVFGVWVIWDILRGRR